MVSSFILTLSVFRYFSNHPLLAGAVCSYLLLFRSHVARDCFHPTKHQLVGLDHMGRTPCRSIEESEASPSYSTRYTTTNHRQLESMILDVFHWACIGSSFHRLSSHSSNSFAGYSRSSTQE